MSWWKRTRKAEEDEAPSSPPPPRPETDAEKIARFQAEYREKDRRDAEERRRQDTLDEAQQARRDAADHEFMLRTMARNGGAFFPGDVPGGPRARGVLQAFQDPGLREFQAELDDLWGGDERRHYQAHQWDPQ